MLTRSPQVCYLPTNTCKDQLSFSRERAECSSSAECGDHEVCYTPDKVGAVQSSLELAITYHYLRPCAEMCVRARGHRELRAVRAAAESGLWRHPEPDQGGPLQHCSTAALQHCSTGTSALTLRR